MKSLYWRMIAACLFAVCSMSVFATDGLTCGSLSLTKGESATVDVFYVGENADYSSVTFTLFLPEGVKPVVNTKDQVTASSVVGGDIADYTVTGKYNSELKTCNITIDAAELGEKLYTKTKGLLATVTLNVATDAALSAGLVDVKIKMQSAADGEGEDIVDGVDLETKVPVAAAVGGVAVPINSEGYATACSAKALDFSAVEGVEAVFTVSKVADNTATLSPIESKQVPAEAGVVVKGTSGTVFVPFAEGSVAELGTNELIGVRSAKSIAEGCYILQGEEFVSCIAGTLPAGKAYLPATVGSSGAKAFTFDFGESTGINEVKTVKADGAIYSISGVRVAEPQKGVYIMNGRKVIVK